jgi:hypothetical protein
MRRTLRLLALVLTVVATLSWVGLGANRGWTRTSVPVETVDPVTGNVGIDYPKKFVPGVDLLGVALLGAGALAAASFLFRKQKPIQINHEQNTPLLK